MTAREPALGRQIDEGPGRAAFVRTFMGRSLDLREATVAGPWQAFVMGEVIRAAHDGDTAALARLSQHEPWLLDDTLPWFQRRLIEIATLNDREAFIAALLDCQPAILRRQPPPPSEAIEVAFTYAKLHLLPLLTRIWPVPDDLPHAAGLGNLTRVKEWFDESGLPALGEMAGHYPFSDQRARHRARDLHWRPAVPRVLEVALAYAVINRHFAVADFLLQHGADINTDWNSHEPASILHHLVFQPDPYESMQFLIDRGIDLTLHDYRWDSTAKGWAQYALQDETMVRFLEAAERRR
jgi:hypothetical protein